MMEPEIQIKEGAPLEYVLNRDIGQPQYYSLDYDDLREDFLRYTMMSDEDFLANIVAVLHFACVVCFVKRVPTYIALSDVGIIHELVHLLPNSSGTTTPLNKIRDQFNLWCCLA